MLRVLLVGCGGFLGSACRYLVAGWVQGAFTSLFPWGTLTVNAVGSVLVGVVLALSLERGWLGVEWRVFLAVGFCGGFTTMSAFGYETFTLIREGSFWLAGWNVVANFSAALFGAWLGVLLGRTI
ncbi:MAG: fluoride efflux transporter CrcB [Candidatus Binatia bacterium]|nr:fluoride efflux transporter CrcB [Candidatus Binatia bacterium]